MQKLPVHMYPSYFLIAKISGKYRSVPQIRPPFCNLRLSRKRRGGLYVGCDNFSRDYALPSGYEVNCRWGVGAKCGASPSTRQRDAHDASGRLKSFSVEVRVTIFSMAGNFAWFRNLCSYMLLLK